MADPIVLSESPTIGGEEWQPGFDESRVDGNTSEATIRTFWRGKDIPFDSLITLDRDEVKMLTEDIRDVTERVKMIAELKSLQRKLQEQEVK